MDGSDQVHEIVSQFIMGVDRKGITLASCDQWSRELTVRKASRASEPIGSNITIDYPDVGNWANLGMDVRQSSGEGHRAKERTHDDVSSSRGVKPEMV